MDAKTAIKFAIDIGNKISTAYLGDLTDDEMMHRPHADSNHIKWQMGHLIASEHKMVDGVAPGSMPPLPEGFVEKYTKETAGSDDPAAFDSKEELMRLYEQQRAGTLAALEQTDADQLSDAAPESIRAFLPTVGSVFSMQGGHWMMHAGQWTVIRRQLGRAPLF